MHCPCLICINMLYIVFWSILYMKTFVSNFIQLQWKQIQQNTDQHYQDWDNPSAQNSALSSTVQCCSTSSMQHIERGSFGNRNLNNTWLSIKRPLHQVVISCTCTSRAGWHWQLKAGIVLKITPPCGHRVLHCCCGGRYLSFSHCLTPECHIDIAAVFKTMFVHIANKCLSALNLP